MKEFPPDSRRKTPTGRDKSVCLAVTPFVMAAGSTEKREKEASRLQPRALPFRVSSNCSLSEGFLVTCLPQRGRCHEVTDEERGFEFTSGCIRKTLDTPRKIIPDTERKLVLLIHRFAVPLPRWGRQRNGPTNPNLNILYSSNLLYRQRGLLSIRKSLCGAHGGTVLLLGRGTPTAQSAASQNPFKIPQIPCAIARNMV